MNNSSNPAELIQKIDLESIANLSDDDLKKLNEYLQKIEVMVSNEIFSRHSTELWTTWNE
jgi:hypothetical protein